MAHHLIWFRNDLRLLDNPALHAACENKPNSVTAIFFITPKQWKQHNWGANKAYFVLRHLKEFSAALKKLNIPLILITTPFFKDIPERLLSLTKEQKISSIFWNKEYEVNEQLRDKIVRKVLEKNNITVNEYHDQTIIPPEAIKTQQGNFYTVFTPFKNQWFKTLEEYRPIQEYPVIKKQNINPIEETPIPEAIDGFTENKTIQKLWPAGEKAAHKQLQLFTNENIDYYKEARNFPTTDQTSKISPYLAIGALSAKTCYLKTHQITGMGAQTWINEIIWREFYRHILVGFPRISKNKPFKLNTENIPWENNKEKFKAWCEGQTGFPIVDAAINQLLQTGWMHNRLRMIVSMFLVKDLHIDWRWGEKFFMEHLIDGDLASNNGGWQWAASTGTDSVPYFRIFNPTTQGERFDPQGKFINQYAPALSPPPIVDHAVAREETIALFKKYS